MIGLVAVVATTVAAAPPAPSLPSPQATDCVGAFPMLASQQRTLAGPGYTLIGMLRQPPGSAAIAAPSASVRLSSRDGGFYVGFQLIDDGDPAAWKLQMDQHTPSDEIQSEIGRVPRDANLIPFVLRLSASGNVSLTVSKFVASTPFDFEAMKQGVRATLSCTGGRFEFRGLVIQ